MIDADEPMMTEHWTEVETLAVMNGVTAETPENFLAYSENFFVHGFQNVMRLCDWRCSRNELRYIENQFASFRLQSHNRRAG